MKRLFLTADNLAHFLAGAALVAAAAGQLARFGGLTPAAVAVAVELATLLFVAREAEQSGDRWRPWRWGAHKHVEWLAGAAGAVAGAQSYWILH